MGVSHTRETTFFIIEKKTKTKKKTSIMLIGVFLVVLQIPVARCLNHSRKKKKYPFGS